MKFLEAYANKWKQGARSGARQFSHLIKLGTTCDFAGRNRGTFPNLGGTVARAKLLMDVSF